MIPVRNVDRSWSAKPGVFCIAMNIVGTPYTAVQRSSWIVCRVIAGSKPGAGITIVAPWRGAAEVAHHHPEAVVERHRDAQPVLVGEVDQLGDEVAVVEDVAVAQGRALGEAGGAGRVLDVDRVVLAEQVLGEVLLQREKRDAGVAHVVVGPLRAADVDDLLDRGLVDHLVDHRAVVAGLERRGRDQQPHPGLVQDVGQLVGAVRRVDVDQDRSDLGGGVLGDRPCGAVGRPDPDPVTLARSRHPGGRPRAR